jgi:hypothetical protein
MGMNGKRLFMKYKYLFPVEGKPKLNIADKIEVRIFPGNDEPMKRRGKPLIDSRIFLDHSI